MKIAMITRSTLQTVRGGDTIQVLETAACLKALQVQADVYKTSDSVSYEKYDLIHFFNIQRPADLVYHAARSERPYVVSPIYLDYSGFDRHDRKGMGGALMRMAGKYGAEYLKNMARYTLGQDKMQSRSYLLGHRRAMRRVLKGAALLLPNSHAEYRRLMKDMELQCPYRKIPNGINPGIFFDADSEAEREDRVLCVAQIYGRKNQHRLIEACSKLNVPLTLIGKSPPNHRAYEEYCKKLGGKRVSFYDYMPQRELLKHYQAARVHALPSWFETTGLATLEAVAMGCNTVVGDCDDTREYFDGIAEFCQAGDVKSITAAIRLALDKNYDINTKGTISSRYTWPVVARHTQEAYQSVLENER